MTDSKDDQRPEPTPQSLIAEAETLLKELGSNAPLLLQAHTLAAIASGDVVGLQSVIRRLKAHIKRMELEKELEEERQRPVPPPGGSGSGEDGPP
ncbi:hypothetical protein [Paracoccus sp. SSK6]|uniref:hypothetical protein n=1 Tax=Paracoccus sp. SSK6 TaxID=3143131 RepID=UPI0032197AF7